MPTKTTYQQSGDTAICRGDDPLNGDHGNVDEWRGTFDYAMVGQNSDPHYYASETIFRDPGVPQGRTIVEATLNTYITSDTGDTDARIYAEDTDDATVPSSLSDFTSRYGTGAYQVYTMGSNVNTGETWSWEITNVIQEIVDRSGYDELYEIGIFVVEDGDSTGYKSWGEDGNSYLEIKYKPTHPINFSASATDPNTIDLTWDAQDTTAVRIQRSTSSYPTSINDGTTVVDDVNMLDEAYTDDGLSENTTYYYSIWGVESIDGTTYYSDDYATASDTTPEAVTYPTLSTDLASNVEEYDMDLNGSIDDTGGEDCDERGFVYDTNSYSDPGDTNPSFGDYSQYVNETGSYGTGSFSLNASSMDANTLYYFRAYAHNSAGYAYGDEEAQKTKPTAPTALGTSPGAKEIELTWSGGEWDEVVLYRDGSQIYKGTSTSYTDTGLSSGTTYNYTIYGYNNANGESDGYNSGTETTLYGQLKYYDGSSWVVGTARVYDGSWNSNYLPKAYIDGAWRELEG